MLESVCVLGAGVIGLSTAVRLQEEIPGIIITVMADSFSPDTTSDGAAGFWEPYMMEQTDEELVKKWGEITFTHMVKLANSENGPEAGTFLLSGCSIYQNIKPKNPVYKDTVFGFREMSTEEVQKQFPKHRYGYSFTTAMTECRKYLPWLTQRFVANGGILVKEKVHSLSMIPHTYDIIVNCSGLGSAQLLGDQKVTPIRGQVMRVHAPWVKMFLNDEDNDLYILPCEDSVVLGGTHDHGQSDTTISPVARDRILNGCCQLLPSLKHATVMRDWVGLRPGRAQVRLEKEVIHCGSNRTLKVVHNYGHGGGGITLHWGCAGDAVALVKEFIQINKAKL